VSPHRLLACRVTRLVVFSPIIRLLTWGRFSIVTVDFGLPCSLIIYCVLILTKIGLGYILDDFFTS
jgi:hypothetical protein